MIDLSTRKLTLNSEHCHSNHTQNVTCHTWLPINYISPSGALVISSQLGFAGALVRQGDSRLSKRVMFGRLARQGPKRGGRPATSWVDCLQKNLEAFGAVPRKGKGRKWVAFGVVVKDGRDWMTAAKNMDKWHRGVERGAEALDSAWRRADLRQSNVQLQR